MRLFRLAPNAIAGVLLLGSAVSANAAGLAVPMDEVKTVTFSQPVTTVFVGNSSIADVTVIDPTHVFLLGRSFGVTNLVALDKDGHEFVNSQITVYGKQGGTVTVQRGTAAVTYACAESQCRAAPVPGDAQATFDTVNGQIEKHQEMGIKAASAAQ